MYPHGDFTLFERVLIIFFANLPASSVRSTFSYWTLIHVLYVRIYNKDIWNYCFTFRYYCLVVVFYKTNASEINAIIVVKIHK